MGYVMNTGDKIKKKPEQILPFVWDKKEDRGRPLTEDEVKKNLASRDYDDTHRKENPLVKAKDAIILDNSDIDKQQQLDFVMRLINDLLLTKE